jgi:Golgi SNAP receptor complex protein 1
MSTTGAGWAQLRQQARSLETQVRFLGEMPVFELTTTQTETLFHTYSQFASVSNIPAKPTEDERQTESKIQDLLEKVGILVLVANPWLTYSSVKLSLDNSPGF